MLAGSLLCASGRIAPELSLTSRVSLANARFVNSWLFKSGSSNQRTRLTSQFSLSRCAGGPMQSSPIIYARPDDAPIPTGCLRVIQNVISEEEEKGLVDYLVPLMSRKRYSEDHFDHVISRFREKELAVLQPPPHVQAIFDRLRNIVKEEHGNDIKFLPPHVIDLAKDGYIGPHVDSVKFSGGIVSSLSLLSARVLRLTPDTTQSLDTSVATHDLVEVVLQPRALYILTNAFRYYYNHEILGEAQVVKLIPKEKCPSKIDRRLSVMFRDELPSHHGAGFANPNRYEQ